MPIYQARSRVSASGDEWIDIHSNGIHTYPLEWTAMEWIGAQYIGVHYITVDTIRWPGGGPGKRTNESGGAFTAIPAKQSNHPEVRTMPRCVAGGAELEPPVRIPHTVYVKSLYRIAGQDYCRHHIIRAAVAAGVITEIRASAGPPVAMSRE